MSRHRRRLLLVIFAVAYGTNVSTPLLLLYQDRLALTPWTVTALFAAYPIGLVPALLLGGPASDLRGRRAVTAPFVLLSGVASVLMIFGADALGLLFAGRVLLGVVSGVVFAGTSAWVQELSKGDDPLTAARLTSATLYAGFGLGPLIGGALGQWGPAPTVVPYLSHLVLVAVAMVAVRTVPETVASLSKAPLRPNLGIPRGQRSTVVRIVVPTALAVFTFPSVAFGLFPVIIRQHMVGFDLFVTGLVAFVVTAATLGSRPLVGRLGPWRSSPVGIAAGTTGMALGTASYATGVWQLLLPASVLLGVASGVGLTAGLRQVDIVTDPATRGALAGTFYVVAYAGMTTPVVVSSVARLTDFAPVLLVLTALLAAMAWWVRSNVAHSEF